MAPINCGKCGGKLPENGNHATCSSCSQGLHLDKCSVKTKSWNSLGANQANWVCQTCRIKKKDGSTSTNKESDVEVSDGEDEIEVSSLGIQRSILAKVDSLLKMKEQLSSIETSMTFLASKYDALLTEVTGLREENKELKNQVEALKNKGYATRKLADDLSFEVAELNQYGRRLNLEIHGVKVESGQREDINVVLEKVAKEIKVEFDAKEVHQAHRLRPRRDGKPATILVQFYSKTTRDIWLTKGRKARVPNVFFGENLCPQYRRLLLETKDRCKTHNYKFVWVKGGRILVKRSESDTNVIYVSSLDDLQKIK